MSSNITGSGNCSLQQDSKSNVDGNTGISDNGKTQELYHKVSHQGNQQEEESIHSRQNDVVMIETDISRPRHDQTGTCWDIIISSLCKLCNCIIRRDNNDGLQPTTPWIGLLIVLLWGQALSFSIAASGATQAILEKQCQVSAPTFTSGLFYLVLALICLPQLYYKTKRKNQYHALQRQQQQDHNNIPTEQHSMPANNKLPKEEIKSRQQDELLPIITISPSQQQQSLPQQEQEDPYQNDDENHGGGMLSISPWKYALWALLDVEANYMTVLAYRYTTLTSVSLLDALAIPSTLFFSRLWFHYKYSRRHMIGVVLCLLGILTNTFSDSLSPPSLNNIGPNTNSITTTTTIDDGLLSLSANPHATPKITTDKFASTLLLNKDERTNPINKNNSLEYHLKQKEEMADPIVITIDTLSKLTTTASSKQQESSPRHLLLWGDALAACGSILYGVNDVLCEYGVRHHPGGSPIEYMAMVGFFAAIISLVQALVVERNVIFGTLLYDNEENDCSLARIWMLVGLYVSINAAGYLGTAYFLARATTATFYNLSLLTSDLWSVGFSVILLQHGMLPPKLFWFALVFIVCGVVLYEIASFSTTTTTSRTADEQRHRHSTTMATD